MRTTIFMALLIITLGACNKYDNFDQPDAAIFGALTDSTGKPLEIRQPGGGSVRLLQWDLAKYPSPGTQDIELKVNGSYSASMLFAGTYKCFPRDGAFMYFGDSVTVQLPHGGRTEVNFKVNPYYYATLSMQDSTFNYTITRSATNTAKMVEVIFMVNNYAIVDESVSGNVSGYYVNLWKLGIPGSTNDNTILGVPQSYTVKWADTHLPKGEYFFRIGVRSSAVGKYNYSPVVKATVH